MTARLSMSFNSAICIPTPFLTITVKFDSLVLLRSSLFITAVSVKIYFTLNIVSLPKIVMRNKL